MDSYKSTNKTEKIYFSKNLNPYNWDDVEGECFDMSNRNKWEKEMRFRDCFYKRLSEPLPKTVVSCLIFLALIIAVCTWQSVSQ